LSICNLNIKYTIDTGKFLSKGKNNPFNGQNVIGKIIYTVCGGKLTYEENRAL